MAVRVLLRSIQTLFLLALTTGIAAAQEWPSRTVRVIVPLAAGSAADIIPRIIFDQVQVQTGQTFVVENRPGGGFSVGVGAVKAAPADGYTILAHTNSFVTSPAVQQLNWDPVKDFSSVTTLASVPMVLVISRDKKIDTLQQLIEQAKAKPGSLNYATAGLGAPTHLAIERLRLAAGFDGQIVPFKGAAEALNEVTAGRVDVYFSPLAASMSLIESGKLVPLAVSGMKRATALPKVPTTTETGLKDADFEFYVGLHVLKDTPRPVIERIYAEVTKALETPAVREKFAKIGVDVMSTTPQAFDQRVEKDAAVAKTLAEAAGIAKK